MTVPVKCGSAAAIDAASGRATLSPVILPSRSSVSVAMPHRTRNRYRLRPAETKCMVLVASPSAIGSTPVASGSSVPACPALAPTLRRSFSTTRLEVIPAGLSITSQPFVDARALGASPGFVAVLRTGVEIPLDRRAGEQRGDALGALEGAVE